MRMRKLVLLSLVTALAVAGALMFTGVSGASSRKTLSTTLTGAAEVPGPGDEDGTGSAQIRLFKDKVCFRLSWENIDAPTMAHIHIGGPDVAGPIVVGLFMAETPLPETINRVGGCTAADPAVIDAIEADPSAYYVNIHNVAFPAGAIRGQLP
jgi:hypothetical protein